MKLRIIIRFTLILSLSLFTACSLAKPESKNLTDLLTAGKKKQLELTDGKTGQKIEIKGEEHTNEFLLLFKDIHFTKVPHEEVKGYQYFANFGIDQMVFLGAMIKINNQYYEADKEIPIEKMEAYFNQ